MRRKARSARSRPLRQANLEVLADKIRADEAEDPLEEDLESSDEEE